MRWLSRLVSWFLGWPLIALVSLVVSVLFHLDTGLGRRLGRDMLNEFVSGEMVGTLHAGYITQLRLWRTVVKDTFVYDPDGKAIIYGETVELGIDPIAALRGRLRFYYGNLTNGWVDLIDDGEGAPTFLAAFEAADQTPTEGEPFHAIVDNMDLRNLEVTGELLGLKDLRVVDLDTKGRMEFYWITDIEVWSADGRIVSPFPFEASLDNVVGSVHTDARGTQVTAEASRGHEQLTAELVYRPHEEDSAPEDPWDLDLFVRVEPITAETLHDVGFDWAESLKGETTGWVRLWGPEEDYRLQADLNTAGGRARIKGELPSEGVTRIEISSPNAKLGEIISGVPDIEVGGRIELTSDPKNEEVLAVELETDGFVYEDIHVPAFLAKLRAREDGLDIDSLRSQYAGGDLYLDGNVEYEGVTTIHVRGDVPEVSADPNFQKYAPDIEGSAEFDLHIRQAVGGDFETKGWVRFDRFDYGALRARFLILEGRIWGDPLKPKMDLELDGAALRVAGYPIGNGTAILTGGPNEYTATGAFAAQGERRAEFQARIEANEGVYRLDVDTIELAVGEHSWRGSVNNMTLDADKGISFDRILMGRRDQRLEAQGVWLFDGPDDIRADLENFDLALLKILYPEDAPDFTGGVDLHFEFRGDLDKEPTIVAEGTLTDANLWDISPVNAAYLIHYDNGLLDADAQVDLGGRGNFTMSTSGFIEPMPGGIGPSLREGVYETTLSTGAMDLTLLELFFEEDPPDVQGYADASIRFSGPIDAPAFKGSIDIPALTVEGWGPVELASAFRYEYGALLAQVRLADDDGELDRNGRKLARRPGPPGAEARGSRGGARDLSLATLPAHAATAVERVSREAQRPLGSGRRPPTTGRQPHPRGWRVPNPRRLPFRHRLAVGVLRGPVRKRVQPSGYTKSASGGRRHRAHHGRGRRRHPGARPRGVVGDTARRLVAERGDSLLAGDPGQRRLLRGADGKPPLSVPLRGGRSERTAQGHRSLQRRPEAFVLDGIGRPSRATTRTCPPNWDGQHDRRNAAFAKPNLRSV